MHYWRELKNHPGSFARLSDDEHTRSAVLFVHGYYGSATRTWSDFQGLIDQAGARPEFATTDLYFYQYPSTKRIVEKATEDLAAFVTEVFPNPSPALFSVSAKVAAIVRRSAAATPRANTSGYTDLVLVGHSMGGVLVRNLALRTIRYRFATGPTASQIRSASVVLFAPAQAGFRLGDVNPLKWIKLLYFIYVAKLAKAYKDLEKSSPILEGIRNETITEAFRQGAHARCFNAYTVWGAEEWVVYVNDYPDIDTRYTPLLDQKGHTDVCKPESDFGVPTDWVADGINRARQPL